MNSKKYSKLTVLGFLMLAIVLLVAALPVSADGNGSDILPEDAKLAQYITSEDKTEMAAVDLKLGQYIVDDFDYAAVADNHAARWQAMADYYASNGLLNTGDDFDYAAAADSHAARWQAMADFYARNGLLNTTTTVATSE